MALNRPRVAGVMLVTSVTLAVITGAATSCLGGPKITVGRRVESARRVSIDQVDHTAWDTLLRHYVNSGGNVNYAGWKQSARDVAALDEYLNTLSQADPQMRASRAAQLAFWINAYNAVTIRGILREYPTTSIRNHTARLYGYNIWKDLLLPVADDVYSLEQIEHDLLRRAGEPRIHFAIVCASRSCPRLRREAYTAGNLEDQLVANTRNFFAEVANFRHDTQRGYFYLSPILKWFADDFGGDQAARLRSIAPYLPTRTAYAAALANSVRISYLNYDWNLNDQATARSARR